MANNQTLIIIRLFLFVVMLWIAANLIHTGWMFFSALIKKRKR
jgi:hypothetical protein